MSQDYLPPHHSLKSLFSIIALVFFGGLLLAGSYLWFAADKQAVSETRALGNTLAKQTTFLIRPLVLADDRISENYLLKELVELDYVSGMQLSGHSGATLARAGNPEGETIQRKMMQQERLIGTLTLWLNPQPVLQVLHKQLLLSLLMLMLLTSVLALVIGYHLRKPNGPTQQPSELTSGAQPEPSTTPAIMGKADNRELIELLRPRHNRDTPEPPPSAPNTEAAVTPIPEPTLDVIPETPIEFTEGRVSHNDHPSTDKTPVLSNSNNPLMEKGRDEEQLDLYSFEHELELILTADKAAYLLYIDTTTAHTEYANSTEKEELLTAYRQLAKQVAHIYSGDMQTLNNGDIQVLFTDPVEKDAHGVNAVCAGLLFTLLYRGFNQERIRQFKPILNLHTALVRGHKNKPTLLQEEARFLTRTTQSNELISHTALTEAPDIKSTLLKDADIRREDEDKVLIHKIVKRYQELFEKQSNHVLIKIKLQAKNAN